MEHGKRLSAYKRVFLILLALSILSQLALAWTQRHELASGYFDFVLYYSAARMINEGRRHDLYKLDVQREYQKDFGVGLQKIDVPFNHAPYELLIFLPLAHFSYPVAHLIWSSFNALLLPLMLRRLVPFIDPKYIFLYGLMLFAYFPAAMALKMGQDSILSTFLLTEAFIALKCKREATAGGLLALGLYKPQLVLPMIGILFFRRRWRVVWAFALTGVVLSGVSVAMIGWRGAFELLSVWQSMTERGHFIWPELMTNLRGLLYVVLQGTTIAAATQFATLLASALIYVCTLSLWRGPWAVDGALFDLRVALGLVTTVLISFHLYSYDASLLLLPLLLAFDRALSGAFQVALSQELFWIALIASYIPLLPNFLLRGFLLAWGAVPILLLYIVLVMEIRSRAGVPSGTSSHLAES
jgi:hypothetical protein